MNVCSICEASLSHHTLYMGNLVPAWQISLLAKKKMAEKKRITAPILKPTDDQKPETFFCLKWQHLNILYNQIVTSICNCYITISPFDYFQSSYTLKGQYRHGSEQTFNRAWNRCPSLRWTKWLKSTGSCMQQQSSRSEQTFNRAWNRCPSLRWTKWLKSTGSCMQQQR